MKKLLIVLMMVAMASFLFVGCLGVTPPLPDEDEEEPEPVLPPSTTPVIEEITNVEGGENIINLYSSATQYMNADEVADGILVMGFAPKYSEVNVYVGGVVVGTSTAYGGEEEFTVFVSEDNLGDDGAKTIYATATELGFAESAPSTVYAFTLDVVAPEMVSVVAYLGDEQTVTVTFNEALDEDIAEDEGNWTVKNISNPGFITGPSSAELISDDEVVELEVDYGDGDTHGAEYDVADLIRAACEDIEDLAGNATTDYGYCYLEVETYTLTVTIVSLGLGTVDALPDEATYNHGEIVTLTATPVLPATTVTWSGDATGTSVTVELTMTEDKEVTATFTPTE